MYPLGRYMLTGKEYVAEPQHLPPSHFVPEVRTVRMLHDVGRI